MFNKIKKILFIEGTSAARYILEIPKPSINLVPQWYKDQKLFSNGKNNLIDSIKTNGKSTYKLCVPLIDSITSGYMIVTPCDILVTNIGTTEYTPSINWSVDWQVADSQSKELLGNYPVPHGHSPISFRWSIDWKIKTPNGYSVWITHPSHRFDLPFTTLNGFVDTDKLPNRLFLPFFIRDGFEGIIKEGTPIAQIIPLKREQWISEKELYSEKNDFIFNNIMKTNFMRSYKNKFWTKKEYR
jgi:hypothetical protein